MTSRIAERRHQLGQVPLEDYFPSEEELAATLAAVQYKTVEVFLRATHPGSRRATGKDNYITGLSDHISDLVEYVVARIKLDHVFGHRQLPKEGLKLSRVEWHEILRNLQRKMVCLVIVAMRDEHHLWRQDGDWCFSQVIRAEHDRLARIAREAKNTYRDQRNWHGRPDKQGRRRAHSLRIAPGTSIGAA